jgi:hypothetical protein
VFNDQSLREICNTPEGPYLRPFTPNPKWAEARIFIVGKNPATPLREEFESFEAYWHSLTQDPEAFERIYRQQHSSGQSKTTKRARLFQNQLAPVNVLTTNAMIYPARPSEKIPNRKKPKKIGASCFQFIFNVCKPSSVLFHGSKAIQLALETLGVKLDPYQPIELQDAVIQNPSTCHLFAFPHFTGQGVKRGYRVREMDTELARLAVRMKEIERLINLSNE